MKAIGTNIYNGEYRYGRYSGVMPPPSDCKVFPVLEDAFFPGFRFAVRTIDPVYNVPHKVLQGSKPYGSAPGDPVRIYWAWEGVSDKQASFRDAQKPRAVNLPIP